MVVEFALGDDGNEQGDGDNGWGSAAPVVGVRARFAPVVDKRGQKHVKGVRLGNSSAWMEGGVEGVFTGVGCGNERRGAERDRDGVGGGGGGF